MPPDPTGPALALHPAWHCPWAGGCAVQVNMMILMMIVIVMMMLIMMNMMVMMMIVTVMTMGNDKYSTGLCQTTNAGTLVRCHSSLLQ